MLTQAWLIFFLFLNWEEYWILNQVYAYRAGDLNTPFQTFHVHLFAWLPTVPASEIGQIAVGRSIAFICELLVFAVIYDITRRLFSARDALFALAAYACAGFVLAHGMSFRTDPFAAMLIIAALWLMTVPRKSFIIAMLAGLGAALALLITIKTALFLPAFGGAFLYRWHNRSSKCTWTSICTFFAVSALATLFFFAVGWAFHSSSLASAMPSPVAGPPSGFNHNALTSPADAAFEKTVATPGFFPGFSYFTRWLAFGPVAGIVMLSGVALAVVQAVKGRGAIRFVPLLFALPLASLLFYRNAYPYFYPFILPSVAICAALFSQQFPDPLRRMLLIILMAGGLLFQIGYYLQNDQITQRETARQVHQMFPTPVNYIDRNAAIPSFTKAGPFMSTWGMEGIMEKGQPVLAPVIAQKQPPMVIANSPYLEAALDRSIPTPLVPMPAADVRALRENYIPHWGQIWIAGKKFPPHNGVRRFTIAVSGPYTLECAGSISLDGTLHACGSTANLTAGPHMIDAPPHMQVTLRWGEHLPRPTRAPPTAPFYYGF
ncbi:MAG: glycosyltransferase family 39 protein [Novosphingobium sp.]|nr:glycosyltransferase family 39 protein [Novosphingobium sp.]